MKLDTSIDLVRKSLSRCRRVLIGATADDQRWQIKQYYKFTGHLPNLEDPRGFLEKLLWLSLYYRNDRIPPLVDKWLVREEISRLIGADYLNELYGVWDDAAQIPFDSLPNQFILKATAGSSFNIICRDKSRLNLPQTVATLRYWQKVNYYTRYREWQYKNLRSRIVAERLMTDAQHPERSVPDIKVYCFNGTPRIVGICTDRSGDTRHDFFDTDWNPVEHGLAAKPRCDPPLQKPDYLRKILEVAGRLSRGFPFVRVDLYRYNNRTIFGEMTFCPQAGNMPIQQPEADNIWGDWLTLPAEKSVE